MVDILLVDDETYVTESLALTIPWQQLEIDQVYQAASAADALVLLKEKQIDILVTDIKMPEKSGLELIEEARRIHPDLVAVLLTGYSDFEYAQRAIKLQAQDFLLKPVDDDAFISCITKQVNAIKLKWEEGEKEKQEVYFRKSDQAILRKQLMHEMLSGRIKKTQSLNPLLSQYEISITTEHSCLLLTVQLAGRFSEMNRQSSELIEYAVGNIAEEIFAKPFHVWHTSSPQDHLIILIGIDKQEVESTGSPTNILRLCNVLQKEVVTYLDGEISIVVSDWFKFPEQLSEYYRDTLAALYRIQLDEARIVLLNSDQSQQLLTSTMLDELYKPPTFVNLLEGSQWQAAKQKLNDVLQASPNQHWTREKLYEAFIVISNGLIYVANKMGVDLHHIDPRSANLLIDRSIMLTASNLLSWSTEMIDLLCIQYDEGDSYNKRHIIKQIQDLVSKELGGDTSVKTIADRVFMHPVYLSKLYKTETGESLGDYIIRMRMEKAVYMLKHTNKKIYEITTELGYQNPQYFSKIFKKYYGCTPNEYRDH